MIQELTEAGAYPDAGAIKEIKDIENEHNKINGTPTTLEIKLYYPTYYLHNNSKPFRTTTIEYNKKE